MNLQHLVARYEGYTIAYVIAALIMGLRWQPWVKRAHQRAARSNIALPPHLEWRVARFLRSRYLAGQLIVVITLPLVVTLLNGPYENPHERRLPASPRQ
jgi:hypothetical protein